MTKACICKFEEFQWNELIRQKDNLPIPVAQREPHLASELISTALAGLCLIPNCRADFIKILKDSVRSLISDLEKKTLKSVKFHWLLYNSNTPMPKYQTLETALKPGLNSKHTHTHMCSQS